MCRTRELEIPTKEGMLSAVAHLPGRGAASTVICCHGMFGYKESSKFIQVAEELCRSGLAALRFDFAGCGQSRVTWRESLISTRISNLDAVLEYVKHQPWTNGRIGLFGSSLGGYISLLAAASEKHSIEGMVCWATPFDLSRIERLSTESEKMKQFFPPGAGIGRPVNLENLPPVAGVLVIHGQQDETVPWQEASAIYQRLGEPKRLLLFEDGDHRIIDPAVRTLALRATLDWFRERGLAAQ